ncbi:MAG: hypothetical protein LBG92_11650 [Prevotellaceae bacterium]|jgi:hypothetical protein|nr:hypothetical protein [Prevotellaceae bacterium]
MKKYIFLISIIFGLYSCEEKIYEPIGPLDPWGPVSKTFVTAYLYPDMNYLDVLYFMDIEEADSIKFNEPKLSILFGFSIPEDSVVRDRLFKDEFWYSKYKANTFKELSKKNGDTSYYESGVFGGCMADPIEFLGIVSDKDYDAAHPAGTLLNDIIYVKFRSATEFVASSYKDRRYDIKSHPYRLGFIEPLTIFNSKKRNLVDSYFKFIFEHLPEKMETHNFTIFYNDAAGRRIEIPVTVPISEIAK